ncbi:MAG: hypothetical protein GY708_00255 [Actinomycetia bacterium]|nr:hypothetical protein [Actinomycetes bacterium]
MAGGAVVAGAAVAGGAVVVGATVAGGAVVAGAAAAGGAVVAGAAVAGAAVAGGAVGLGDDFAGAELVGVADSAGTPAVAASSLGGAISSVAEVAGSSRASPMVVVVGCTISTMTVGGAWDGKPSGSVDAAAASISLEVTATDRGPIAATMAANVAADAEVAATFVPTIDALESPAEAVSVTAVSLRLAARAASRSSLEDESISALLAHHDAAIC